MRNILLTFAFLSSLILYSQNNEQQHNLHFKIFNSSVIKNSTDSNLDYQIFVDILRSIYIVPSNNSEGKFQLYNNYLNDINKAYSSLAKDNSKTIKSLQNKLESNKIESIIIKTYSDFILEVINKTSNRQHNVNTIALEDIKNKNIKNTIYNFEHKIRKNKLNKKFEIHESVSLEIGKDIYKHINKIYKSEIDKTLQNSINLLVINCKINLKFVNFC